MWYSDYIDDFEDNYPTPPYSRRHGNKLSAPVDIHLPNKNEAKVLRRIMSETGLTEKEIRTHKKYRIKLSEAQKVCKKSFNEKKDKELKKIMKSVTTEFKLAKEHPLVIAEFNKRVEKAKKNIFNKLFWL